MADFSAVSIDEMEGIYGGGFKRARAALDVSAFGMSVSDLPPSFEHVPPHTHTFDDQEEIYVALSGDGWIEVDGERVPLDTETVVKVDAEAVRRPISGPQGLRVLSVGAAPGKPYEAFPNSQAGAPEIPINELPGVKAAAEADVESSPEPRFTAKRYEEMDSFRKAFHFVRASLGISAFGVAMIAMPPNYPDYPRHDETQSGQEEVYIPLGGGGELEIEGEHVALSPGMMVRVGPEPMRKLLPGDDGIRIMVIGGRPGAAYEARDFEMAKSSED